jgi:aspartyl protease family protein
MLQKLALVATIGGGLAIGLLWPTPHHSAANAAAGAADVVLSRSGDHHYYADANVNGRPVHFMIDTGADQVALTEADAQAIGLHVDPNDYQVVGDGASGMIRGQYVQLKTIDLGGIKQHDVPAVVVQGATVSLLGQPFLEKLDQIVISHGEIRLTPEASS